MNNGKLNIKFFCYILLLFLVNVLESKKFEDRIILIDLNSISDKLISIEVDSKKEEEFNNFFSTIIPKFDSCDPKYFINKLKICIRNDKDYKNFMEYIEENKISCIEDKSNVQILFDYEKYDYEKYDFFKVPYQLDRIDQPSLPLDNKYNPKNFGEGINVYIVDDGIDINHIEFKKLNGENKVVSDFTQNNRFGFCAYHGTYVASVIGGETIGVSKGAILHDIDVSDKECGLNLNNIINGLIYIINNGNPNSIINFSWSSSQSKILENLLVDLYKKNFIMFTSSGNKKTLGAVNGCSYLPSKLYDIVFSVGSIDQHDRLSTFSKTGECVHYYLPGDGVFGAERGTLSSYNVISGTSFSVAILSGEACIIINENFDLFFGNINNNNNKKSADLMFKIINNKYISKNKVIGGIEHNNIVVLNDSNNNINIPFFLLIGLFLI